MTYYNPKNVTFVKTKITVTYFETSKLPFANSLIISY